MRHLSTLPFALAALLFAACAAGPAQTPHPLAGKAIALPAPLEPGQVDLPRYPSISPDGSAICFSWRGDLWRVDATGGQATRLTAHPMLDDLSVWSPDGKEIAFNSDRSGFRNVYRMQADGTNVSQVTAEDRPLFIHDWTSDNTLTLTGFLEADVHKNPRPYAVATTAGPITRLHDAFGRSPVVSPDGRYVAFVRGRADWDQPFLTNSDNRDLWLYDRQNRSFKRLTENPGSDGKPRWLSNNTLLYLSARPPARVNLYRMNIDTGEADSVAITAFSEDDVQSFDLARDGQTAVLHVWDTLYTLDLKDPAAKPMALKITAPTDSDDLTLVQSLEGRTNQAALSPDAKVMAVSIHGELFIRTIDSQNPPQRITDHIARDDQAVWSPDGRYLYFTSDRDGSLSIYRATVALTRSEIEASIKNTGKTTEQHKPEQEVQKVNQDDNEATALRAVDAQELAQDDKQPEEHTADKPQQKPEPNPADRWHDAIRFTIEPVVVTAHQDSDPSPSPDGKTLAFRRGNGDLMLLDLTSGVERLYLASWDNGTHWTWSADSRYLAVSYEDQNHNADIWLGPADGSTPPVNLTRHPASDVMPSFSHDGKIMTFLSSRHDNQFDLFAVYLDQQLENYTPQQLADYYKTSAEHARKLKPLSGASDKPSPREKAQEQEVKPGEQEQPENDNPSDQADNKPIGFDMLSLEDAYLRLRRLTTTPESERSASVLPGGERVVFARDANLYTIGYDAKDEKKIADGMSLEQLSLTGSHLTALRSRTPVIVALDGGKITDVKMPGSIRVDRRSLQKQRFLECSRALTMAFYDGSFKGIDWSAATAKYADLASRAWTADEFDDVANRYLGLLNASHMGIRSPLPTPDNSEPNGRLGATYKRVPQGFEVVSIEPRTPAAEGVMRLQVGDLITAIDFKPFASSDTVTSRLLGRVGRETAVTVLRQGPAGAEPAELHLLLTPISYSAFTSIRYNNWHLATRAKVHDLTNGRIGYIHIASMNESSLSDFERDLYAACEGRDGLIIDVRDNGGGWTTDRLLASIMTQRHAYTVPRGADPTKTNSYPVDRLFIPRYNLPINALCNENSFSNAEIFSHAFKTLKRGTLVGNTSAGGVISTGSAQLLDGTTIRLPFRGWYLPDGTDMENNGAMPDLLIPQLPEDESAGRDAQLEAAVNDLLNRLDAPAR